MPCTISHRRAFVLGPANSMKRRFSRKLKSPVRHQGRSSFPFREHISPYLQSITHHSFVPYTVPHEASEDTFIASNSFITVCNIDEICIMAVLRAHPSLASYMQRLSKQRNPPASKRKPDTWSPSCQEAKPAPAYRRQPSPSTCAVYPRYKQRPASSCLPCQYRSAPPRPWKACRTRVPRPSVF